MKYLRTERKLGISWSVCGVYSPTQREAWNARVFVLPQAIQAYLPLWNRDLYLIYPRVMCLLPYRLGQHFSCILST